MLIAYLALGGAEPVSVSSFSFVSCRLDFLVASNLFVFDRKCYKAFNVPCAIDLNRLDHLAICKSVDDEREIVVASHGGEPTDGLHWYRQILWSRHLPQEKAIGAQVFI